MIDHDFINRREKKRSREIEALLFSNKNGFMKNFSFSFLLFFMFFFVFLFLLSIQLSWRFLRRLFRHIFYVFVSNKKRFLLSSKEREGEEKGKIGVMTRAGQQKEG